MKKTIVLVLAIVSIALTIGYGQGTFTAPVKKMRIAEVYIQSGGIAERITSSSLEDFRALAPHSVLLEKDFDDFESNYGVSFADNTAFTAMLGIQFGEKGGTGYRPNPVLRVGFTYISSTVISAFLNKEDRKTIDTLTSAHSGTVFYLDSVREHYSSMNYSYDQARLDISLIFRTNPAARWSLHGGLGLNTGISVNAYTNIFYDYSEGTEVRDPYGISTSTYSNYSSDASLKSEHIRNKANFGASVYLPLGVDFRIGRNSEFWQQIHLYYEMRPGINVTAIPELRTITEGSVHHGLGIKVTW